METPGTSDSVSPSYSLQWGPERFRDGVRCEIGGFVCVWESDLEGTTQTQQPQTCLNMALKTMRKTDLICLTLRQQTLGNDKSLSQKLSITLDTHKNKSHFCIKVVSWKAKNVLSPLSVSFFRLINDSEVCFYLKRLTVQSIRVSFMVLYRWDPDYA